MRKMLAIIFCAAVLAGCANPGQISRRDVGTVVGGVAGGYAGSALTGGSTLGTVGGALGGAYIGNQLAK